MVGVYSTRERPPASTRAHGPVCKNNCQQAFALSEAVWLSHRAIIMIQPWVRLRLKGETKWSCVTTFSSLLFHITVKSGGLSKDTLRDAQHRFWQDDTHMEIWKRKCEQTRKLLCVSQERWKVWEHKPFFFNQPWGSAEAQKEAG